MPVIVQKFGGTSVADATKIRRAAQRAVERKREGNQVLVVVSARGKKTDELIGLAAEITEEPPNREMDMLLSTGEQESAALTSMAVQTMGEHAVSLTGTQIGMMTDDAHSKARIRSISTDRMRQILDSDAIVIACGFQGIDDDFNITTLGRGGSDTTATALAAVLQADLCEIFTDVEGVFTTDPRLVASARKIDRISYDEMLELASLGAGVMHSRSIEFAKKYNVPIRVRPAHADGEGTLIAPEAGDNVPVVTGLAIVKNEARVSLTDLPDRPGVLGQVFSCMADRKIPIDMVVQDIGTDGKAEVSFTVPEGDLAASLTAAHEAVDQVGAGCVRHGTNVSKVSVVGAGMRTHTGVAAQMFQTLAQADIGIGMITTSEIKISVQVQREDAQAALNAIHDGFGLGEPTACSPEVGHTADGCDTTAGTAQSDQERLVVANLANMEDIVVSEVQLDPNQARVTIRGLPDEPGVAGRLFAAVAEGGIMVDMIVQNVGCHGKASITFTIPEADTEQALLLLREVLEAWPDTVLSHDKAIAKLSVMGIGLRSHTGVGQKMFQALSEAGVNIQMVNTSEIRISTVVASAAAESAHQAVLTAFDLHSLN